MTKLYFMLFYHINYYYLLELTYIFIYFKPIILVGLAKGKDYEQHTFNDK